VVTVFKFVRLAVLATVFALSSAPVLCAADNLTEIEAKIAAEFPALDHMNADKLDAMVKAGTPVMIFDVREENEFAVSRLAGARRVAPNSDPAQFVKDIATEAKGKQVVFYCSVGKRSSTLASKAAAGLTEAGAAGVHNLKGGIFRWSNEGRPLEKGPAAVPGKASNSGVDVHPYNSRWGQLIDTPAAAVR
jgi:rhodanese-related sulfurtransferase